MTSTNDYSQRIEQLHQLIADADYVLIGAGAGLSAAAGLDYAGEDFRQEFREWINRYGITDLYSASFYPFKTEEELWAQWAKHIWFARYRPKALPLYRQLFDVVREKRYFVITTNVDGQFEKAGFDISRIFATQGDYALFQPKEQREHSGARSNSAESRVRSSGAQPKSGFPKETWSNQEWVNQVLPLIKDCRIPTELIPRTPDGQPVSMNLRCDDTFVEDTHWHQQARRYQSFVEQASTKRLLLLELGVGFNTPVIIRFPFERMAAQFPQATLVRFNRDYPQLTIEGVKRFIPFIEELTDVISVQ